MSVPATIPAPIERARPRSRGMAPVLVVCALLVAATGLPYLMAHLHPPVRTRFVGAFYYIDDFYNYLSYVEQAEEGAFLFRNKLVPAPHAPALINLEWWTVGRISSALGRRPVLAYRLFGILAALALAAGADRWLRASGLPESHRVPALLLVLTGAGLGGLLFELTDLPVSRCLDLSTGLFPFIELLANPHFAAGTALLLWSLWAFAAASSGPRLALAILLGSLLGLVRPYDFVLLCGIRTGGVLLAEPPRRWPPRLAPLAGLFPIALYDYWVFYRVPAFSFLGEISYVFPSLTDLARALGPAALGALLAWRSGAVGPAERTARAHLLSWAALAGLVILIRPTHFSLQFLVGVGVPLLCLTALGLARWTPAATVLAIILLGNTAVVALRLVSRPNPHWFVPANRIAAALALRESCRPGDVAISPPDIGLYLGGLTSCTPYVSHSAAPQFAAREALVRTFYAETTTPARRSALLDGVCATHLVLPGRGGDVPASWLGESTVFRRIGSVEDGGQAAVSLYARPAASIVGCSGDVVAPGGELAVRSPRPSS